MKKNLCALVGLMMGLVACGPSAFVMNIDMRGPSKSGMDLAGKSVSVAYLEDARDTAFSKSVAEGFASALEKEYFGGEQRVGVFKMPKDRAGDYADADTLRNLVMDSEGDVVFLFDVPEPGEKAVSTATEYGKEKVILPLRLKMYAYDSMGKQDTVRTYTGRTVLSTVMPFPRAVSDYELLGKFVEDGSRLGERSAQNFLSQWQPTELVFYYYEGSSVQESASQAAYECRWHDAMELWMSLLGTNNAQRRSSLSYNIATACYVLGDLSLASQWLDRSDSDYRMETSKALRKLIDEHKR